MSGNQVQLFLVQIVLISTVQFLLVQPSSVHEDYDRCRHEGKFWNTTFVCDPHHRLPDQVIAQLDHLLIDLQNKVPCDCDRDKCSRGEGLTDKYSGLLFVTNSTGVDDSGGTNALKNTMAQLYKETKLGSDRCENGLVILYIVDQQKIATYRGKDRFALLTNQDVAKLHKLSMASQMKDREALLLNGSGLVERRADSAPENWIPIFGLIVALALILVILLLLLIIVVRLCCCKRKSGNGRTKQRYYVNPPFSPYKTIEPVYVPSAAQSEIYGPPLSHIGSPPPGLGIPPVPIIYGPQSRSVTPTSTHRLRKDMVSATPSSKYSTTPQPVKREKPKKSHYHGKKRGTQSPSEDIVGDHRANGSTTMDQSRSNEFPFLDPRRKLEVQTREDFIE